jgi:PAS domain S-box-containing protein
MKHSLEILHLEDDLSDRELIRAELAGGGFHCQILYVDNRADFTGMLQQATFDVILAAHSLPPFDGLSALAIAREQCPDVPFIFVSGILGEEALIETLKSGATDYVLKSRLSRLVPAVHRALAEAQQRAELKRSEHATLQSEHKYRLLFECLADAAFLVDAETGRVLDANTQAGTLLALTRAEIIGVNWSKWFTSQSQGTHSIPPAPDVSQASSNSFESEIIRRDGKKVPVLIEKTPITLHGKSLLLELVRDITERKRAEAALRVSESRYRRLFESAQDGILILDASTGEILDVNPFLMDLLGYPRDRFLGRRLWEIGLFKDIVASRSAFDELQSKGCVRYDHLPLERSEGRRVEVEFVSHVYLVNRERLIQCNIRDITGRKQSEEALRNLSGRLLQVQDEERRRIARELHTTTAQQLASLAMNNSLVKNLPADRHEQRTKLLAESGSLIEKVSQEIRTLSYLLHPPLLDETGLGGALRDYADGLAKRSGLGVRLDIPEDWARLSQEHELALFRVAQESLGNVNRHSGSATATIRLSREAGEVWLEVLDAGCGILPEQLQRASAGATGLGVGITSMRERMHQLGGRLEISSGAQGTAVRACLPATELPKRDIELHK